LAAQEQKSEEYSPVLVSRSLTRFPIRCGPFSASAPPLFEGKLRMRKAHKEQTLAAMVSQHGLTAQSATLIDDQFDDGDIAANTLGVGTESSISETRLA
jgi:hypothetical protein